jgi:hypothetical protein
MNQHPHPLTQSSPSWEDARLSPWSRFGDDEWRLDIRTAGRRADQKRFSWALAMPEHTRIGNSDHAQLVRAAKHFLWSVV